MSKYIIQIKWLEAKEWILFDSENIPEVGDFIETTERWCEPSELVSYQVRVLNVTVNNPIYELVLEYLEDDNEALRDRSEVWGTSTITIHLGQEPKAEAIWASRVPNPYYDVAATSVAMLEQALIEDLGYTLALAKKRKQSKFRDELKTRSSVCEISGEQEESVLQAAHIVEVESSGGYVRANGLLMRADIHLLYDSGLLDISDQGKITLSEAISTQSKYRAEVAGWAIEQGTLREVAEAIRKRKAIRGGVFEEL